MNQAQVLQNMNAFCRQLMYFIFHAILSIHTYNVTYVVMKNVLANGSSVLAIGVIVFDVFASRGEQSCNSKLTCQVKCVRMRTIKLKRDFALHEYI